MCWYIPSNAGISDSELLFRASTVGVTQCHKPMTPFVWVQETNRVGFIALGFSQQKRTIWYYLNQLCSVLWTHLSFISTINKPARRLKFLALVFHMEPDMLGKWMFSTPQMPYVLSHSHVIVSDGDSKFLSRKRFLEMITMRMFHSYSLGKKHHHPNQRPHYGWWWM